jgi:RimJ/RimL family protein N-acetyltransferase
MLSSSIVPEIEKLVSTRLVLRNWTENDSAPFAGMHADAKVMHDHPAVLTQAESVAKFERYRQIIHQYGFGRWAVERRCTGDFLGYTGVQPVRADLSLAPGFEIGWRFCRHAWGHGYATEAARLALADVFFRCGLAKVFSFTGITNIRSEGVMRRIGMHRCQNKDFVHPNNFNGLCVVYQATPADQDPLRWSEASLTPG